MVPDQDAGYWQFLAVVYFLQPYLRTKRTGKHLPRLSAPRRLPARALYLDTIGGQFHGHHGPGDSTRRLQRRHRKQSGHPRSHAVPHDGDGWARSTETRRERAGQAANAEYDMPYAAVRSGISRDRWELAMVRNVRHGRWIGR